MLVDSHCHLDRLDLTPYQGQLAPVLAAAEAAGVQQMLSVAVDLESWPVLARRVDPYPQVALSVGVHPAATRQRAPTVAELCALAQHPKVVAIGETGLDYFHDRAGQARQQDWFRLHIAVAKATGKPLIIHSRDARDDTLRLLEEEEAATVGGVIHCFSEDWATAVRAMALNFHISFSGIVTFRNASVLQNVAQRIPADRMLVETDAPYLAPAPHRGKPNQPAWVRQVAECVARLRGVSLAEIAATTTANYQRLFGHG